MRDNTITAVAGDSLYIKTDNVFQYDYGLKLVITGVELPQSYEVHFSNTHGGAAKTVTGDTSGVEIPDEYLLNGEDVHAYIYLHTGGVDDDGETVYHIQIPVVKRAAIDTRDITPVEHTFVEEALATVEAAVEKTDANVANYPYINEENYWMVYDADAAEFVDTGVKARAENTFGLQVGTVTTLAPGEQASVNVTWSQEGDAVLNFGLPAGDPSGMVSIHDERSNTAMISVVDGADNVRLDEMWIRIIPIQSGNGAPGTRNIRRISGVTGITITHNTISHEVSFPASAGTVYSGTYYPLTGKLYVDKVFVTKRCVDMNNTDIQPGWNNSGIKDIVGENVSQVFTDQVLNIGTSYGVDTTNGKDLLYLGYDQYGMRQTAWVNTEITVQICVELPEPVEYDLDPVELSTSLGNNTFSVDTGEIAYMKYPCDTKKYIDHKIAELQALVLEN